MELLEVMNKEMGSSRGNMMAVISKEFCSSSEVVFVVRKRPHVVTGGGFVVTDCNSQNVVFRVEGCGVLGKKDELLLRDGDGDPLLLIRRKVLSFMRMHNRTVFSNYSNFML